jgi:Lon-like ATP-dependent protease
MSDYMTRRLSVSLWGSHIIPSVRSSIFGYYVILRLILGGSSLYIESVVDAGARTGAKVDARLFQTGNLGDVMKESSLIAYSYASAFISRHYPDNKFFDQRSVHLHVPEGAIAKDGPSAGVSMCTSLVSLALNKPAALNVAMTGELSLTGRVLKIGGVKEKLMAAKRAGVTDVILPAENKADYDDLDSAVKSDLSVHFVTTFEEVHSILFANQ